MQVTHDTEIGVVRARLGKRLRGYLHEHGIGAIELELSTEPPMQNPKSGKYQQVIKLVA